VTAVVDADLQDITETIWGSLFRLPLEPSDAFGQDGHSTVTSVVHIDGAWHGAVMLRCPMALAAMLTAAIFQAGDEPDTDDIGDAIGELANMAAGNVKALLPEPCSISLPAVAFGCNYQLSVVGAVSVASAAFTCAGHPLLVTLLERAPQRDDQ
jgi:chemotaxis protein CheX